MEYLKHAYTVISGNRYDTLPRLKGNMVTGKLFDTIKTDGSYQLLQQVKEKVDGSPSGKCYYWVGNQLIMWITEPEDVKNILIKNGYKVSREKSFTIWSKFFGDIYLLKPDENWKRVRKVLRNELFLHSAVENMEPKMNCITNTYLSKISDLEGTQIDFSDFFNRFALDVLGEIILNSPNLSDTLLSEFSTEMTIISELLEPRNNLKWSLPEFARKRLFPHEDNDFNEMLQKLKTGLYTKIYAPNKENIEETENILRKYWQTMYPDHEQEGTNINFEQVLSLLAPICGAGTDTIKSTAVFLVKLLSANPAVVHKLRQELTSNYKTVEEITLDKLNKIDYLEQIIKETMRMYPSIAVNSKYVLEPLDLKINPADPTSDFLQIDQGTILIVSPYITHRSPKYWDNPDQFIPERFNQENIKNIPVGAYFPFSIGVQDCIGKKIAMSELKLLMAKIYYSYEIELTTNDFELTIRGFTLQAKNPTMGRLRKI